MPTQSPTMTPHKDSSLSPTIVDGEIYEITVNMAQGKTTTIDSEGSRDGHNPHHVHGGNEKIPVPQSSSLVENDGENMYNGRVAENQLPSVAAAPVVTNDENLEEEENVVQYLPSSLDGPISQQEPITKNGVSPPTSAPGSSTISIAANATTGNDDENSNSSAVSSSSLSGPSSHHRSSFWSSDDGSASEFVIGHLSGDEADEDGAGVVVADVSANIAADGAKLAASLTPASVDEDAKMQQVDLDGPSPSTSGQHSGAFPSFEPHCQHTETFSDTEPEEINDGFDNEVPSSRHHPYPNTNRRKTSNAKRSKSSMLSVEDVEIMQRLDHEYERALEEREVGWTARYNSVRQSACFSLTFMGTYLALGTVFFQRHTEWDIGNSLLFSIYTITTVGYGNHYIPQTPNFQMFTIIYIFAGIATLTIMVAQVYQCIALEATRAQYNRDRADDITRRNQHHNSMGGRPDDAERGDRSSIGSGDGNEEESVSGGVQPTMQGRQTSIFSSSLRSMLAIRARGNTSASSDHYGLFRIDTFLDGAVHCFERTKHFLRHNQIGRGVSVLLPFAGLILIGALVVGPIEGWTFIESLYFSVVSLTTVGFGDYHPSHRSSVWFCVFWLPFSVGFMSLYLGSVAHFYIRLSNNNVQRLERTMRRRIKRAKERAAKERAEAFERAARAAGQSSASIQFGTGDNVELAGTEGKKVDSPQDPPLPHLQKRGGTRLRKGFQCLPSGDESGSNSTIPKAANLTNGGAAAALFGSPEAAAQIDENRRERIMKNASFRSSEGSLSSGYGGEDINRKQGSSLKQLADEVARPRGTTMSTMKDILRAVHAHVTDDLPGSRTSKAESPTRGSAVSSMILKTDMLTGADAAFMTLKSNSTMGVGMTSGWKQTTEKKPPFALRVLVQERMAKIVATDIAGYQSHVEIKENTLSVTIDTLKVTADKWMIPRRARKAFRAVAFEALYFVGERGLITRGADALFDLTPFEFHALFGPLLAAMGDADTMEGWLARTHVLADTDLKRPHPSEAGLSRGFAALDPSETYIEEEDEGYESNPDMEEVRREQKRQERKTSQGFPNNKFRPYVPGNAFSNQEKKTFKRSGSSIHD